MTDKATAFLERYGMHYRRLDLDRETVAFAAAMQAGLTGKPSDLLMLPSYLMPRGPVPAGERVMALDAGGTHFRRALLTFPEQGAPVVEQYQSIPMPGSRGTLSAEAFFAAMADAVEPLLGYARRVGFCFSYPARILPRLDAEILMWTKEISVEGAEGLCPGAEINRVLAARGCPPCRFTLLNDTTAGLLGGMAQSCPDEYDGYIGFILGTGTNTCYLEQTQNIGTIPSDTPTGRMAVNLESGGYGAVAQGSIDRELDEESANPGRYKLEKMVSGAYFGAVTRRLLGKAVGDGLLSPGFGEGFAGVQSLSMPDIDRFCTSPHRGGLLTDLTEGCPDDRRFVFDCVDALFERAARLTILQIGGILLQTDAGRNPLYPVCVAAEGSFFTKSPAFRAKYDAYAKWFLTDVLGRTIRTVHFPDATLAGAAAAALIAE